MIEQGDSEFLNMKERLVKCPGCQEERMTRELGPVCYRCKRWMITVIKPHFPQKEKS